MRATVCVMPISVAGARYTCNPGTRYTPPMDPWTLDDIARELTHARELPNASDRAIAFGRVLHQLPGLAAQVRAERAAAVDAMKKSGMSWDEVGKTLGVHRNRAAKLAGASETEARAARRRRDTGEG